MYICLCNPTTDLEIEAACNDAASSEELKTKLRICQCCKSCSKEIDAIYQKHSNSYMQPPTSGCE